MDLGNLSEPHIAPVFMVVFSDKLNAVLLQADVTLIRVKNIVHFSLASSAITVR